MHMFHDALVSFAERRVIYMYKFKIDKLKLNTINGLRNFEPKRINVIIGPNNSGKSRFLKELRDWLSGDNTDIKMINQIEYPYPENFQELDESYNIKNKITKDMYGNWILRTYLNKSNQTWDVNATFESYFTRSLNSIASDWEDFFKNIVQEKNEISFFQHLGPLFFRYLGTEERLTICRMQKNYGLDSTNTNYLTSFKFEDKVLRELSANVKRIFNKDIVLDTQTLGDRLGFRIGDDFEYLQGKFNQEKKGVLQLFHEKLLDDEGDGLKSYVSTFLSLKVKENDVLLIDEPEAFLHPPLARQLGELIGDFDEDKQIFVSTHSVEILKGILSRNTDINVIRITQPKPLQNNINLVDSKVLQAIIQSPLLRVSRVLEGLFCEKVVITEAEADELIYQELIEKVFPQSGLYFAHGQNKQTLAEIAEMYKAIDIRYEVITDFDILRVNEEFNKFVKKMPIEENEKQRYREYLKELREEIDNEVDTEGMNEDEKKKKLKENRDKVYHQEGIRHLNEGELKENIKIMLEKMSKNHLHILNTGELETLLSPFSIPYTNNKSRWVIEAIDKIASLNKENIKENRNIYEFLEKIVHSC